MMKGIKIYMITAIIAATGCRDFLEESSQDRVRPSTLEDLEQMLLGNGYVETGNFYYGTEIFTDNVANNGVTNVSVYQEVHDRDKWKYTWDERMFAEGGGGYDSTFWEIPYQGILGCNLVLDYVDEMEGSEELRESLRGEALTLRAWYYLHLVNLFGVAYNQGNPTMEPGIPLKLNSTVTGEYFNRNTVGEVYAQIERDLLEGNRLLKAHDRGLNFFRMGHLAAKAILSRMYLYMEDWEKAAAYADSVLFERPELLDFNTLGWTGHGYGKGSVGCVYTTTSPDEIIWARNVAPGFATYTTAATRLPFAPSDDLWSSYENGSYSDYTGGRTRDIRGYLYFSWQTDLNGLLSGGDMYYREGIAKGDDDKGGYQGIRTAELYLNRAEARARLYALNGRDEDRQAALDDLNEVRRHRYNKAFAYNDVDANDAETLLNICMAERRRELCGETNHRWCDLRRTGATVTHVLIENGRREYQMEMGQYVLPIPDFVLECNPGLQPNN